VIEDFDVPLVESGQAMTMLTSLLHGVQNFIPLCIYIYIYIYIYILLIIEHNGDVSPENSITLFYLELCYALPRLLVDLRKKPVLTSSYMARLDSSDYHVFTESEQICN